MEESWMLGISALIAACAFLALVIYLIITLVSLRKTLDTTREICQDLEVKVHSLDPLFRVVHSLSSTLERKADVLSSPSCGCGCGCAECSCGRSSPKERRVGTALEVAEWALIGVTLWNKIRGKR